MKIIKLSNIALTFALFLALISTAITPGKLEAIMPIEKQCELLVAVVDTETSPDYFMQIRKKGVDLNTTCEFPLGGDFDNTTALIYAVRIRQMFVQPLLSAGANPNAADKNGNLPLTEASDITVARRLIKAGANVNGRDINGDTSLIRIVRNDSANLAEYVSLLLKSGANPDIRNNEGQTAVMLTNRAEIRAILTTKTQK